MKKIIRFIGVYDYTVILTYLSLLSAVFGMTQAIHGDYKTAIFCLALSGIFDAFDGRVARMKKDRTEDEKAFGIQLDSLCDVIAFGMFPAMICYLLGVRGIIGVAIVFFYCMCGVCRLAFFNVLEGKRQQTEGGCNKVYHGLPITSISFILPLTFWLQFIMPDHVFVIVLHVLLIVVGFLFILDFPLKKPDLKMILALIAFVCITVGIILAYTKFRLPDVDDKSSPIIEDILEGIYEDETP